MMAAVLKILITVLRSVCAYVLLLVFGRLIGRKMISRITCFDFLVGVTLGSLAVRISLGSENSLLLSVVATAVITLLVLVTDRLNLQCLPFRKLLEGEPVVLVSGGIIVDGNLKKARISVSKLLMMLREKNMFNVAEVELAVIENDGELSIMPKALNQPATKGDLNKNAAEPKMPADIIIDGRLLTQSLDNTGYSEQRLTAELRKSKLTVDSVFYAGLDTNGSLYISPKGGQKNKL